MISEKEVLEAMKILKTNCKNRFNCTDCPMGMICTNCLTVSPMSWKIDKSEVENE